MALLFRLPIWPRMILELDKTGSGKSKIELAGIGYWRSPPMKPSNLACRFLPRSNRRSVREKKLNAAQSLVYKYVKNSG